MSALRERLKSELAKNQPKAIELEQLPMVIAHSSSPTEGEPTDAEVRAVQHAANATSKSQAEAATKTAIEDLEIFIDQHDAPCLIMKFNNGRKDAVYADSTPASDCIKSELKRASGKRASRDVVESILAEKRADARARQDRRTVHQRTATDGNDILLDLANVAGEVCRISPNGYNVEPQGDILFRRGSGAGPLPHPTQMTAQKAYIFLQSALVDYGVPPGDVDVLVVLLAEYLRPNTPKPILELTGPAGARKSTLARILASIIDPTQNGELPSSRLTEADIMASVSNRYVLHADNISSLDTDQQDLLSRISTGGEISHRRLYEQRSVESVRVQNPFISTSITPVVHRSDARSRTITIALKKSK